MSRAKKNRGCWLCKPWRRLGNGKERRPFSDRRRIEEAE